MEVISFVALAAGLIIGLGAIGACIGIGMERIDVVVHPQSIIHSMVQYRDNSIVAQLGSADMRVPIAYGLSWPDRIVSGAPALDFQAMADMTFESFDINGHWDRFPGLRLAWRVLEASPGTPAILNAANEVAVENFLQGRIRFDQIHAVNEETLAKVLPAELNDLPDLIELDQNARRAALATVGRLAA